MRLSVIISSFEGNVRHLQFNYRDYQFIRKHHLPKLTRAEMAELRKVWPCFKFRNLDLGWSRMYKVKKGFSPYFVNDVQYAQLLKRTNPINQVVSLQNKALCDVYFPDIPFPTVFVRRLNGVCFDTEMNQITLDEACKRLLQQKEFVVKPSVDTRCGAGVEIVNCEEKTDADIKRLLEMEGDNFIAQEVVSQHEVIHRMNETSLNCCRIATLWMGGKFDYAASLKIGKKGAHIDNWNSSYFVGIQKDGTLMDVGYDSDLKEVRESDSGIVFAGLKYPYFDKMTKLIERMHKKYFPNCGIIGWDILIDASGEPKVIETNLDFPGIRALQLCNNLFFEPFHDEIMKIMSYEKN